LNGGGREVSVHQARSPFTADSIGSHLQQEAMQQGTTEIYLQINSTGATREGFLKILPQIRNGYLELRGITVKIFGSDGSVWWNGVFGGPKQ
jgi:ribosomal protein S11